MGGYPCDWENRKEKMDGIVSHSNSIFTTEEDGDAHKITQIVSYGAIVAQMFETEGVSHLTIVNRTDTLLDNDPKSADISVGGSTETSLE